MQVNQIIKTKLAYDDPWEQNLEVVCSLEIIPLGDGRITAIASSISYNAPNKVRNGSVEWMAMAISKQFAIDPSFLILITSFQVLNPKNSETLEVFERVEFARLTLSEFLIFQNPSTHLMTDQKWLELGLEPRGRL